MSSPAWSDDDDVTDPSQALPPAGLGEVREPSGHTCADCGVSVYRKANRGAWPKRCPEHARVASNRSKHSTRTTHKGSPTARRPSTSGRRADPGLTALFTVAWGFGGLAMVAKGPEPIAAPVGKVLQLQAPFAGQALDRLARKHPLYRTLDVAAGGILADLGPIVLPPLLVGVMAANPTLRGLFTPLLAQLLVPLAQAAQGAEDDLVGAMGALSEPDPVMTRVVNAAMADLFAEVSRGTSEGGESDYPEAGPAPSGPPGSYPDP